MVRLFEGPLIERVRAQGGHHLFLSLHVCRGKEEEVSEGLRKFAKVQGNLKESEEIPENLSNSEAPRKSRRPRGSFRKFEELPETRRESEKLGRIPWEGEEFSENLRKCQKF